MARRSAGGFRPPGRLDATVSVALPEREEKWRKTMKTSRPDGHGYHWAQLPWITFGFGCRVQSAAGPQGGRGSCRVAEHWFPKPTEIHPTGTRQETRPPWAALRQTAGIGNTTAQTVSGRPLSTGQSRRDGLRKARTVPQRFFWHPGGIPGTMLEIPYQIPAPI